jgi:hypothetical protein
MLYIKAKKNPVPTNFSLDKELEIYYASLNIKAQQRNPRKSCSANPHRSREMEISAWKRTASIEP